MGVYEGARKGFLSEPSLLQDQYNTYVGSASENAYLDLDNDATRYYFCGGRKYEWTAMLVNPATAPASSAQARDPNWSNYKWNQTDVVDHHVEHQRRQTIPDWAFRDVLYMLIDYSERAYALLHRPLSQREKNDLFEVFIRIGEAMYIPGLPKTYAEWKVDRRRHLVRDLSYSKHTSMLYQAYRRHLGVLRYYLLLEVQALLVPDEVRGLLRLNSNPLISGLAQTYGLIGTAPLQSLVHTLLIPPRYWSDVRAFDRTAYTV